VAHPRRPDPAQGIFETLLVLDGRPIELDAHLARLESSLAELFPDRTVPSIQDEVHRLPVNAESGVLRVTVAPTGGELTAQIEVRDLAVGRFLPPSGKKRPTPAVRLQTLVLAGGLGAHKWSDRSLLDEGQARLPEDTLPLIVDEDGAALEASRASVFAERDGTLFTPPLDGRILPGITRMRVLKIAAAAGLETEETALDRDDLLAADEVFLTGSVRGVEAVASLDGAPLAGPGPLTRKLAAELRRAWSGAPVA
jgi:para-aminobenzoate synthetase / 4-amino-4-deoxychorismate lyase